MRLSMMDMYEQIGLTHGLLQLHSAILHSSLSPTFSDEHFRTRQGLATSWWTNILVERIKEPWRGCNLLHLTELSGDSFTDLFLRHEKSQNWAEIFVHVHHAKVIGRGHDVSQSTFQARGTLMLIWGQDGERRCKTGDCELWWVSIQKVTQVEACRPSTVITASEKKTITETGVSEVVEAYIFLVPRLL